MFQFVKQEILDHGDKSSTVPLSRLNDIAEDIEALKSSGMLNGFQKYIVNDLYAMDLPEVNFELRSIIIVASPSPALVKITFNWKGNRIPLMLPAAYVDKATAPAGIELYLNEYLNPKGYHVKYAPQLPRKLLAVRSGLGQYGRNNICYVQGMGSFLNLAPYFSDIPCTDESWHKIHQMDLCKSCTACLVNCPTAAIISERFLIDNERCLTYFNEGGGEWDFPEWIDPSSHNAVYGCLRCQTVCPVNKQHLENIIEPVEFTAKETLSLLEGKPLEHFSDALKHKVQVLDMGDYLSALPRNLKVLFDRNA